METPVHNAIAQWQNKDFHHVDDMTLKTFNIAHYMGKKSPPQSQIIKYTIQIQWNTLQIILLNKLKAMLTKWNAE